MTRIALFASIALVAVVGVVVAVATSGAQAPGPPTGSLEVVLPDVLPARVDALGRWG